MTVVRIDGRALAEEGPRAGCRGRSRLRRAGLPGDDPRRRRSGVRTPYVGSKHTASHEAGIDSRDHRFPSDTAEATVLELIDRAERGRRRGRHPRPVARCREHIDEPTVLRAVDPDEGRRRLPPFEAGRLNLGKPASCRARPGRHADARGARRATSRARRRSCIGRSEIVGKPMAMLLHDEHATVTICHRHAWTSQHHTRPADILVAAVGRRARHPATGQAGCAVIDVGDQPHRGGQARRRRRSPARSRSPGSITPVPGGVGPMTIAMLLRNTLTAAQHRRSQVAVPGS